MRLGVAGRAEGEDPAEQATKCEAERVGEAVEFGHFVEVNERLQGKFADGPDDSEGHREKD